MSQKLTMNELRQIFEILVRYAEKWRIKEVSFKDKDNYYFKIEHRDRDFEDIEFLKCPKYSLGSLADDIAGLKDVLNGKYEPCTLDLERLGAILTALGATMLEEEPPLSRPFDKLRTKGRREKRRINVKEYA